jgi:uncharacterized membrane protein
MEYELVGKDEANSLVNNVLFHVTSCLIALITFVFLFYTHKGVVFVVISAILFVFSFFFTACRFKVVERRLDEIKVDLTKERDKLVADRKVLSDSLLDDY